jgi:glyoxylase-like metal-dependent hydrolase (beta-lactamase superfamily II)
MIRIEKNDDVVRFEMSHRRSRLINYSVSAYLVRGVLVDCGFPALRSEVTRLLDAERLRGVMITHRHEDHAGNAELVASRGIPLAASAGTLASLRSPARIGFYRRFTWGSMEPLRSPVTPLFVSDLQLLPAPGHSSDLHVVWDAETRTLFGSDLFLGVKVRVAHANEDPRRLVESLRMALRLGPARLFDGHRGLVTAPSDALPAKIAWMEETIGRIDRRLESGDDDEAIARAVLGRRPLIEVVSRGDYSRLNFVRALRRTR